MRPKEGNAPSAEKIERALDYLKRAVDLEPTNAEVAHNAHPSHTEHHSPRASDRTSEKQASHAAQQKLDPKPKPEPQIIA